MGLVTAYGISKTTHPKLLGFLLVFVSSHIINSKSPWLIRKDYTTMYWWPLCHIVSLLCFFTTQWVAYRVLFKSPCKVFLSLACYFSDDSIIGDFNSTAKKIHVQQVLLFLLMFWVHVLQENPLKYSFQDPKNLAVCSHSMGHSAHNSLSAWTDNFIFSDKLLFAPPAKWRCELWNVHFCPVNICTTSHGFILRKLQKKPKKLLLKI